MAVKICINFTESYQLPVAATAAKMENKLACKQEGGK